MERDEMVKEVLDKLIGPIYPAGDSALDYKRLENLQIAINVAEDLIYKIQMVANRSDAIEYSINKAGTKAERFLEYLGETIETNRKAEEIERRSE